MLLPPLSEEPTPPGRRHAFPAERVAIQKKKDQVRRTRENAASKRSPKEDMVPGITQSFVACEMEMSQEPVSTKSRDEKQTKTQWKQFLTVAPAAPYGRFFGDPPDVFIPKSSFAICSMTARALLLRSNLSALT